ncbi:DUF5703 domain-containing protein [Bacteroidota bacterium]
MNRLIEKCLLCFLIIGMTACSGEVQKTGLEQYNVVWSEQSNNSSESMPLVGGDTGCNVWVENGDVLLYMQRSGCLSENGEYLKLGRIRLRLDPNPFDKTCVFTQELKLEEGYVEIVGKNLTDDKPENTKVRLWIDVKNPVIHIDIFSDKAVQAIVYYESWRIDDKELKPGGGRDRWGCFSLEAYPGKIIKGKDEISFEENKILFYHRNPEDNLVPGVLIKQQELEEYSEEIVDDISGRTFGGLISGEGFIPDGHTDGLYGITPFKAWKLVSKKPAKKHRISIVSHINQTDNLKQWKNEIDLLAEEVLKNHDKNFNSTVLWWKNFWDRSWINIFPDKPDPSNKVWQAGRNYQLFRYQLGGNAYGEYPTKFNGGNLTFDPSYVDNKRAFDPDWRAWGGSVFTAQNQRLVYWPMLKSGDFETILPQLELYRKGLPGAEARVKKYFGHKGALFSEYTSVPGLALGAGWGWKDSNHRTRGEEIPFGDSRADGLRGYNDLVERGVMANPSIAYHWESQVEHAYMALEYNRYSGKDISAYIPFIKSALIFFDEHYQKRRLMLNGNPLDKNGKLVIYPSSSCESYRGAKNPSDLIAGLQACISSILELKTDYFSESEKEYFRTYLKRLPDYSYDTIKGKKILKPAESWGRYQNVECPQFYPLFPFNRFSLNSENINVFRNTWELGEFPKDMIISWHQDGIFYARMGMTQKAAEYNIKKLQDSERRFPTFWGPGHDWVPDHNWGGSGMIGLQEMLMQCFDGKIYLLPAWPKEWDVQFKLHAPNNTTVEAYLQNGVIKNLKVTPSERKNDVIIL